MQLGLGWVFCRGFIGGFTEKHSWDLLGIRTLLSQLLLRVDW